MTDEARDILKFADGKYVRDSPKKVLGDDFDVFKKAWLSNRKGLGLKDAGVLAIVHHEAGRHEQARAEATAARRFNRRLSLQLEQHTLPFLPPKHRDRLVRA